MINEMLAQENSRNQSRHIADYVGDHKTRFRELMKAFASSDHRMVQRASWSLSICIEDHPKLILPYWNDLIGRLETPGLHPAVYRNITRLLQFVDIPSAFHGRVMTVCFDHIQNPQSPIATKAFSLTVLHRLSYLYPEITSELKLIIEERMERETAAFRSRGKKILTSILKDGVLRNK